MMAYVDLRLGQPWPGNGMLPDGNKKFLEQMLTYYE